MKLAHPCDCWHAKNNTTCCINRMFFLGFLLVLQIPKLSEGLKDPTTPGFYTLLSSRLVAKLESVKSSGVGQIFPTCSGSWEPEVDFCLRSVIDRKISLRVNGAPYFWGFFGGDIGERCGVESWILHSLLNNKTLAERRTEIRTVFLLIGGRSPSQRRVIFEEAHRRRSQIRIV